MVTRRSHCVFLIATPFCLGLLFTFPAAKAGPIQPWAGATATAGPNTQTGSTASALDQWTTTVDYLSSGPGMAVHTIVASGGSLASAGGTIDSLLHVQAFTNVGDPGTNPYPFYAPRAEATATWTNDRVVITPPPGGSMPDSIRLQFALTFNPSVSFFSYSSDTHYGGVRLQANDKTIALSAAYGHNPNYSPDAFDQVSDIVALSPRSGQLEAYKSGNFHIDLTVNKDGVSAPFSLRLDASNNIHFLSNASNWTFVDDTLSLKDVTFLDGMSLATQGYEVAFDSGLRLPAHAPEPASAAFWSFVTVTGVWAARRRSRA